jgi:predicted phosphoribosyltransferase
VFYDDFRQLSDDEVIDLLRRATHFAAERTAARS